MNDEGLDFDFSESVVKLAGGVFRGSVWKWARADFMGTI